MRLGILILPDTTWATNVGKWRAVEQLGFDAAWTYDHVWWRGLREHAWFAAMPVLAAAAAVTERIRNGLMVASPNFRHPVMVAKEAIAIDDISAGRFVLGVGSGAPHAGDAEVLGGDPLSAAERADRFREFVELTDQLLDNPVVSWTGRHYRAQEARMIPGSVQEPRLPLAVAASGRAGLDLAARHGDAWITAGPANWLGGYTPQQCLATVADQLVELEQACDRAGRDFRALERIMIATPMCGDPLASAKSCLRIAEQYAEIGMSHLVIHWPRDSGVYAGDERVLEDIATEVLPRIAAL
jgi:alkanesulfonate monooxygenase SsuD/methylene tetrahydromethanopterin reductase-like flavin-dependent oxidoreductase (luciferase family)